MFDTQSESVILVNSEDEELGVAAKLDAHREGQLHRAFSVFITDDAGRILLHRRAIEKYHSGGLWTNACCGHPRQNETTKDAAERRLREEMGVDCDLGHAGSFIYSAQVDNGLTEHELDHVFTGHYSGALEPDPAEVQEIRWIALEDLILWLEREPDAFTAWFREALAASRVGTMRSSTFAEDITPGTPPPG